MRTPERARETTSQAIDAALARSDALRLLAAGLRDPDGPDRPELELTDLVGAIREVGLAVGDEDVAALRTIVERDARAAGHRRVFGHTIAHGCPPNETEFGERHVFGQAQDLADIAGYYAAFGLRPALRGERVDHLACELEFLAILALKEAAAIAARSDEAAAVCRQAEASFLRDHLARWLPALAGLAARRFPGTGHAVLLALAARLAARLAAGHGLRVAGLGPDDLRAIEEEPSGFWFECGDPEGGPGLEVPG
jgi:TorA maturation chaperone TorD